MRVLFTTFAAKSHMYAQVPLAWALHTAGHEVRVASQPDLAEDITRTGLTAVPVGAPLLLEERMSEDAAGVMEEPETDPSEIRPEVLTWDYMLSMFTTMTPFVYQGASDDAMVDDLVSYARWWRPDLVIWDTMTFAGPVAARASGAAQARLLFGLDLVGHMRQTYRRLLESRPAPLREDPLAEWLGWSLDRYGSSYDEEVAVGQFTIDSVPPSLRLPVQLPYVNVRFTPYNGAATIPDWLRADPGRPRVCISLGLGHREIIGDDRAPIAHLLDAVSGLDIEVVATLDEGQRTSLPEIPENVRVVDFVPLDALLPTCSAIIHHGGAGTFGTALVHGVPQIIFPDMIWDTVHKARRLDALGAGVHVPDGTALTTELLRGHLRRVLDDPAVARNAARLRAEALGSPSPNSIVPVLERLTAQHRPRSR
ncbi:activator-dependent family glycosyltransferase [Streptomyces griseus]|uniref:activator-dependent family glycosyltransferase n=1 Tax=Streptomyces griseus TaxID=1911 RepID=UPI00056D5EF5|nr:activator-dependent family glycosyltransferase [Streptomyces griseus]